MKFAQRNWPKVAIEDFTEVVTGGTPSTAKPEYWKRGNVPWINSGELNKRIITRTDNFITEIGLKNSAAKMMPKDTVLVALTGATTGVSALLKTSACGNQSVTGILPSKRHHPHFLFHYMQAIRSRIVADSYGGAQKHISQAYVKKIRVPLPPVDEQARIANLLDEADELRKLRAQADRRTTALIPALFHEMFGDPATNERSWKRIRLCEVCENVTDGTHDTPERVASGVPFITSKNIRPYQFDLTTLDYVTEETHREIIKRCNPRFGDVLYTNIGVNIGNAVANRLDFAFSLKNVALIQPDFGCIDSSFLESLLNNTSFKQSIMHGSSQGGAQKFVGLSQLRNILIVVPPLPRQKEFSQRAGEIRELEADQVTSHTRLDALFQSMLHRAFNGEL